MKILMLTYEYPRILGGGGVYMQNLVQHLRDLGVEIYLLNPTISRFEDYGKLLKKVDILHNVNTFIDKKYYSLAKNLKVKIVSDILHPVQFSIYSKPISEVYSILKYEIRNLYYETLALKYSDVILVLSNFVKEYLKAKYKNLNIKVIHQAFARLSHRNIIKNCEERKLVFPNVLRDNRKGFNLFLEVLKEIVKDKNFLTIMKNFEIVITGNYNKKLKLKFLKLAKKYGLLNIIRIKNIENYYKLLDLFSKSVAVINLSLIEGFGRIPLEVIAVGGVSLTTLCNPDLLIWLKNKENCILLKKDKIDIKNKLQLIIEDENLRRKIRENAIKTSLPSWKDLAKKILNIYSELLNY